MGSIPDWFWEAVEAPREEGVVEVEDVDVRWQAWGTPGAPGLLLVHGMFAHAHWWDFIAPRLADRYRIAALDLSGMGDSDYRYEYDGDTWADELRAVADATGLGTDTVIVGHSFGGRIGLHAAVRHADRFAGLVMADAGVRDPDEERASDRPPMGGRPVLYPDAETARNRFRLQPPQPCANEFLVEYIARNSVMDIDDGWAFKFDTDLLTSMSGVAHEDAARDLAALELPLALVYGADSELFSGRTVDYMRTIAPRDFEAVALPDAQHHLFLDQPLAFVETLAGVLDRLGTGAD
ncbi:MAG: alpha/beta hydrolase [Pseudomonadales bacterium]|jgi:pimeloyl-ACP methyl ester carboxylesterase|nr:alpha/beta hydrolase [Pseudomonadales bacterium]